MADEQVVDLRDNTVAGYLAANGGRVNAAIGSVLLSPKDPKKLQTVLSVSEARRILAEMKEKYPEALANTKVQLGGHDVPEVFKRTWNNKNLLPGFRHLDALGTSVESVLAGLTRSDHYHPWTDTVTIYSNSPGILRHELGHAVDFNNKRLLADGVEGRIAARAYPEILSRLRGLIPGSVLWPEGKATQYALATTKDPKEMEEARSILYPAFGTYVGGSLAALRRLGMATGKWGGPTGLSGLLTDLGLFGGSVLAGHGLAAWKNRKSREAAETAA